MSERITTVADRLYALLPAIHRERDVAAGGALRALLGVIGEQVDLVEQDIERLYDDWFIETCDDWVVPYIGELVGYRTLDDGSDGVGDAPPDEGAGEATDEARPRTLVPRRDVARTIADRRRKGSLALLVDVAAHVAGWPARVVEYDRLLAGTQALDHLRRDQGRTATVRDRAAMGRIGGAFDASARTVDVRRPQSLRTRGRHNLQSVAVFLYRARSLPVTRMPANCVDRSERACYTFSVLGDDVPLFVGHADPAPPFDPDDAATLPGPLTRALLTDAGGRAADAFYGVGRSFALWRRDDGADRLVPRDDVMVADLGDWATPLRAGTVAVDPERGRIVFGADDAPEDGLLVSYHYGFGDAIGGGEYPRPARRRARGAKTYRVGPGGDCATLDDALQRWQHDRPADAVIELEASEVHTDPKPIVMRDGQRLEIRAADGARPLIDLRNRHRDAREYFGVRGAGGRLHLVGLLVTGRALQLRGHLEELTIDHCTFVPGWDAGSSRGPDADTVPSLRLENVSTTVRIAHSIVGAITVVDAAIEAGGGDAPEPLVLEIVDSIVDATSRDERAIGTPDRRPARVRLTALRSTVIGHVDVARLDRAEDTVFDGLLHVRRRQDGCVRFCHVAQGSTIPRAFQCQPDTAAAHASAPDASAIRARVRPSFVATRYGAPGYAMLSDDCPVEIARGAHDGGEMGVFHDLDRPRRLANLRARIDEYVPAGVDVGLFFSS